MCLFIYLFVYKKNQQQIVSRDRSSISSVRFSWKFYGMLLNIKMWTPRIKIGAVLEKETILQETKYTKENIELEVSSKL